MVIFRPQYCHAIQQKWLCFAEINYDPWKQGKYLPARRTSGCLILLYTMSLVLLVSGLVSAARQHQHLQHMARRQLGRRIRDTENAGKAGCVSLPYLMDQEKLAKAIHLGCKVHYCFCVLQLFFHKTTTAQAKKLMKKRAPPPRVR